MCQFSSVTQSYPTLCNPMDCIAHQASLSITKSWNLLKLTSIKSVMPSIFVSSLLMKGHFSKIGFYYFNGELVCFNIECLPVFFRQFSHSGMASSLQPHAVAVVAHHASLSITNSQRLLQFMSIELVMSSIHLILCRPLLLLPSIFSSIRVFSSESVLCIR